MSMTIGRRWGMAVGVFFTVMLVPVGVEVWSAHTGPARLGSMVLLVAYAVVYLFAPSVLWTSRLAAKALGTAVLGVLGIAFIATQGLAWMPLLGYAYAVAALLLPLWWSAASAFVLVGGFAVMTALMPGDQWGSWLGLLMIIFDLLLMGLLVRSNAALHRARHELAALAVSDERGRVARDLHDVLGHTLTSLAIKSALARKLLDHGLADRASREMAEVEQHAREALVDLRATVSGFREVSLAAELAGAQIALAAGGIGVEVAGDAEQVPAQLREAFAFVVREGVTNVLRHSSTQRCVIRIAPDSVEILDDGPARLPQPSGANPIGFGNGLAGLRQRVASAGGSLTSGPRDGGGFGLLARVS
jgi:two-component system sensor histidine kinase DesK